MRKALVTGAGGFIGGAVAKRLQTEGQYDHIRTTDIKVSKDWWSTLSPDVCDGRDLRDPDTTRNILRGVDDIYHLAADMGGMDYIETHPLECLLNNFLIDCNVARAILNTRGSHRRHKTRVFWASSACAYPVGRQSSTAVSSLPESLAWDGKPEDGYGVEKLAAEELFEKLRTHGGIETHVARLHNVYGPHGSWEGGREKAPAAICRKVAEAVISGNHTVTISGDGTRTRSFMYVDDCAEGIWRLMNSDVYGPINLGSEEQVSIRQLVELVAEIAAIEVEIECDMTKPQGVAGRNSDNTMIREKLGWEPSIPLRKGLSKLYAWVEKRVKEKLK